MTTDIDSKIKEMLLTVEAKKKELLKLEASCKQSWVTNCAFKSSFSSTINLAVSSEDQIVKAASELVLIRGAHEEACEALGIAHEFKHEGYSFDEWITDFKKRIASIQIIAKKDTLKQLETRLNSIVSPEQRRAMELEVISNTLNSLS